MESRKPNKRKVREGVVISQIRWQKTVTVRVENRVKHPHFEKTIHSREKILCSS